MPTALLRTFFFSTLLLRSTRRCSPSVHLMPYKSFSPVCGYEYRCRGCSTRAIVMRVSRVIFIGRGSYECGCVDPLRVVYTCTSALIRICTTQSKADSLPSCMRTCMCLASSKATAYPPHKTGLCRIHTAIQLSNKKHLASK